MTDSSRRYSQFFAEMKRRRVFRVMAAYGIIGFGIIEAAEAIFPRVALPDWAVTLVVWLTLLGFPIAMLLAWAFDATSEGMKRTEDATPEEISEILAQPASRRWPAGLLALVGVVLLFGGWWMGRQGSGPELNLSVPAAQADTADFVRVAILPFENVGADERNDVLADGLHMDLQQQLGRLSELRVTWPMSVREYRASEKGDREIAEELGVDYLLRGSVRRSGDLARVDVVLVDARSAENLWGEQYDREITPENLFDIQSGIALAVARELATELSPADLAVLDVEPPTADLAALAAYNRAREIFHNPGRGEGLADAAAQAERAVELDPGFVQAWGFLTRIRANQASAGNEEPRLASEAVRRTEELAPGSVEALTARAFHAALVDQDGRRALALLQEAERRAPSDVDVIKGIAVMHKRLGQWAESITAYKRAISTNPRSPDLLSGYAGTLRSMGRMAAADEVWERALQVAPSNPGIRAAKVLSTWERYGDTDRARSLAAELRIDPSEYGEARALFSLALFDVDLDVAARLAAELPRQETTLGELDRLWRRTWVGIFRGDDLGALADSMQATGWSPTEDSWDEMMGFAIHASKGDMERAWPLLEQAVQIGRDLDDVGSAVFQLDNAAGFYAMFGRPDEALDLLEETVGRPGGFNSFAFLTQSPDYLSLRGNPRFEAVVERRRAYEEQAARNAAAESLW